MRPGAVPTAAWCGDIGWVLKALEARLIFFSDFGESANA